jgi:hypothetical protein
MSLEVQYENAFARDAAGGMFWHHSRSMALQLTGLRQTFYI